MEADGTIIFVLISNVLVLVLLYVVFWNVYQREFIKNFSFFVIAKERER